MSKLRGYALIAALIMVITASLATTVAVNVAQVDAQRERELQLLFVGNQFREALASYYAAAAGGVAQFPETLEQLLIDKRWPEPRHHLRRLWSDPITHRTDWALIRSQGRIIGVHSRSKGTPLKRANFGPDDEFTKAESYQDWVFMARESAAGATTPATSPAATTPSAPGAPASLFPPATGGPPAASPAAPQSPPPEEPGARCARMYSQNLNACAAGDAAAAETCRETARDDLRRCLQ